MSTVRGQFSSRFGFIMAAAGSAVGLGNVWGFPTQTASNGGAAFVLVCLLLAFLLAYPALMAELIIGRHARANVVTALGSLSTKPLLRFIGQGVGYYGVLIASLILSFYTIVAGWMLSHLGQAISNIVGLEAIAQWLVTDSIARNLSSSVIFAGLTMSIIACGIEGGIEKWSRRLMPLLMILLVLLILYVFTLPGAMQGLKVYLLPDLSQVLNPDLLISALGQAFFSLSLGVGTMLIYGSYVDKNENLPQLGAIVTCVDLAIAFTAGLLIIPAVYVAQHNGTVIFNEAGDLIAGPGLIFQILPSLFSSMGSAGLLVATAFFALMSIAAVTSSISMLEVPVSTAVEKTSLSRLASTLIMGGICLAISSVIIFNFDPLFGFVVDLTTKYSEPLVGIMFCVFAGWVMHRNALLQELKQGNSNIENSLFWKIWPWYVRVVCPLLILATFAQSLS
ncbi:sodium-dependent transporter [Dasania sp. GY-MA-18]|uniref:Sodium-dependent transporter n=1 Tax=Dasania phycosphaerae TaxID=2950436 RepID=A0A9J6RGH4_9GAMM|nr:MULTISPECIES: sodium-dependent transporter [Dasania]MCR8921322.1 sodium-dependent transporter [Dasania sp. GY-MA-18]MCZ0863750.1 sodium-dependent transporter [Dasania phycosphaerae]MCZ0867478.1 sodium-dependent transporter [Dasania phycosphaerae]